MIVEYVRYQLPSDEAGDFEATYLKAAPLFDTSPHCISWELRRGVESPNQYVMRVEWDSRHGHEEGWRGSPEFREFLSHVRRFEHARVEMEHYELVRGTEPR